MSSQQRARLPPTPGSNNPTSTSASSLRYQNIDVQNNTISTVTTATDTFTTNSQIYNNNNDDTLNALGSDLALSTSQVLDSLTDHERSIILDVLSRDESVRQRDAARIMLLRAELQNLRKRSALKTGTSLDRPIIIENNRSCARCRTYLGRIINRGAPCRACKLRVCKGCREFTNRTDWVCVVCNKQIELQNASGEWMNNEVVRTPPRRGSITQSFIPTADIIRKSISRSWTISNPEDDQQLNAKNGIDPRIVISNLGSSGHPQETNSFPNLRMNKSPYSSNMDFNNSDSYDRTPPTQRRVLRQSTLPNPDSSYPSNNLKLPVSPKQQVSPQYSPYHTDNENEPDTDMPQPQPLRYQIRRQSTLPCKPNEHSSSKYLSTSPNRNYSRSPDPSAIESEHNPRFPQFTRQATFPSNNGDDQFRQRQLPTSPNRLSYNKSPDSGGENGHVSPRRFMRQSTLPNPDQHIKLLPTSPPKKSPSYIKRSPEFQRQNTISNPEGMSTLSVHQHGPKFLPISPRQKQSFLFPQPSTAPRTFLSQQHFPTMNEDQPPPTALPIREHSKMIKVRSHSNEEYSFNKSHVPPQPSEGRRLLPEIPNRARSPSRLVRQDHVKDEGEKRSPILKTFAEAKQTLNEEYDGHNLMYETQYTNEYTELNSTFAEADENNYNEQESAYNAYESLQQNIQMDISSTGMVQYVADQTIQFHDTDRRYDYDMSLVQTARNDRFMSESSSEYYTPDEYIKQAQKNRNRRRKSRELPAEPEVIVTSTDDESKKHKPETMRSVSEDSSPRTMKVIPRRSFSQPEKETQKKIDASKIPSPKPLTAQKSPSLVKADTEGGPRKPVYKFPKMLEMRGDSKSFDAVVKQLIKNDNKDGDDKSHSMDDNLFSEKKEHKTTLNEAEIQNAVEQAAGLFKKVVLQRRKERKPADEGEMAAKREESSENELKYSYITDVDDYKLVFISSDSSGKEDDFDDSSSTTSSIATKCSIVLDECDWDYFEPSAQSAKSLLKDFTSSTFSPFGSPSLYRRRFDSSPLSSPLFHRGMSESPLSVRKSDTGTDEEILNVESSSQTSSEGFLPEYLKAWKKNHKCKDKKHACKCGQSPHYVAIPVPILVPMDTFQNWNSSGNSDLLQLWNTSSNLLYQHDNKIDVTTTLADAKHIHQQRQQVENVSDGEEKEKKRQKVGDVSITSNVSCTSNALPPRRSSRSLSCAVVVDTPDSDTFDNTDNIDQLIHKSGPKFRKFTNENNKTNSINTFASASSTTHLNETIKITNKHETNTCGSIVSVGSPYTSDNLIKTTSSSCNSNAIRATSSSGTMISVGKLKAPEAGVNEGYLVSESVFSSSDDESGDEHSSKTIQRSYDVAGAAQSENIVAPGSSDIESTSSNHEDVTSGTDASDSEDTGIDDRRSKLKRFTKVFVVNKNAPTSESDSCSSINVMESSSSDDEDSSDNDTDTDGITLNYMKPLEQEEEEENNGHDSNSDQEMALTLEKAADVDELVILNSVKTIDNDFYENVDKNEEKNSQHNRENETESEKVNGTSENVAIEVDDKNKLKLPSNGDVENRMTNESIEIEIDDNASNCDSLEPTNFASNTPESVTDGDSLPIDSMDVVINESEKKYNLSMILNDKKVHFADDVRTGFADDENSLKIESLLNDHIDVDGDNRKQHEPKLQTPIVNNDNVPAMETGFNQHNVTPDVLPLLSDRLEASTGNNNTESENNSCVKQNVNEETAQELNVENCVGGSVSSQRSNQSDGNGKFTSLIMITQQDQDSFVTTNTAMNPSESHVNVISSDTTQIVTANSPRDAIVVQHRNWQPRYPSNVTNGASVKSKIGFYEENINKNTNGKAKVELLSDEEKSSKFNEISDESSVEVRNIEMMANKSENDDVKVITSNDTLSAVVCLEDGLADDDSWVEDVSQQDSEEFATETGSDFDSSDEMTLTAMDREEELRGYNRVSIDFTLHTIVEESCEESEYEAGDRKSQRISASELEKYFFFGLGDGNPSSHVTKAYDDQDESPSETSSVCSEGLDSLNGPDETLKSTGETLASSRLEKYFLSGFMGFSADGADGSDGSGSVGSDSEGRPSPEQRRKKLVRARGTGRSHSSSLDNLLSKEESLDNHSEGHQQESGDSSETDTCDDPTEKTENHSDTVKRKKKSKKSDTDDKKIPDVEVKDPSESENEEDGRKTPQPEFLMPVNSNLVQSRKQHSRDSGFIGSNDDLLKSDGQKSPEMKVELEEIQEEIKENETVVPVKTPPPTNLTRKDSFNAWSSDEETNLMMSKMRQFFKSLVAASANSRNPKTSTSTDSPTATAPKTRQRPPQLVYFENELTRLMKTVPGIKDEQVRELVEYFSSEDTWSDSYDSSDYTSSDKESAVRKSSKIQQQISASCQQIIEKFDNGKAAKIIPDEEGDMGDGGLLDDGLNKETAFVYQKLVASINKIADEKPVAVPIDVTSSPPIIAKVMHHIGSRLVALMHEVSSGESLKSNSPKQTTRYHRRLQAKISATTTEDDDSTSESNFEDPMGHNLPRSKSHDLLLGDAKPTPDTMNGEEREASDYERFSWRGSFESALLTNCDSRNKLSTLDNSNSALSILAAKRRSAGDLLFSPKSLSREQLDRVRSCGSIGGAGEHDLENSKLWESTQSQESTRRRSGAIGDDTDESSDNDHHLHARSTLPRSLQTSSITASTTNSLPRLPTTSSNIQPVSGAMQKAQSVYQFLQNNVKSARYRAPGFNRPQAAPKRALSAPGLQPMAPRRDRRSKVQSLAMEETHLSDTASSPVIGSRVTATSTLPAKTASHPASPASTNTDQWPAQSDEDIDRLVAMHQNRHNSLSSLGLRSDSMASVYSGAGEGRYGIVQVKGMVEFGMQYNYKQGALEIHVKQCKDLAAVDTKRNRSDPYVKVYLLPDKTKSGKRKTKVKKHTLNPVFDEVLRFYMSLSSLESRTLWVTVWHSDMFGRNDFLGEVMISLQNKVFDNPQPQWYQLEERSEPFEDVTTYRGDIIVGLKFVPGSDSSGSSHSHGLSLRKFSIKSNSSSNSANNGSPSGPTTCSKTTKGSLHVMVKEAKHLSAVKANGNCDAFCKSYLLPDKNRSSKQKTPVAKRTTSPQWNYTFVYDDLTLAELSERALELTIWDHDRLASNEFLGGIRFSLGTGKHYGKIAEWNDGSGKELTLWQSMINRPNFWVEGCLSLRSTLEHRLSS